MIESSLSKAKWKIQYHACRGSQRLLNQFGLNLVKTPRTNYPERFTDADIDIVEHENFEIINQVLPYTLTSPAKLFALIEAVKYVINGEIRGAIVECGVWRGGSMMAAALTLIKMNAKKRNLFLYDTYAGMTEPMEEDVNLFREKASKLYSQSIKKKQGLDICSWHNASLEEVKSNLLNLGYPNDRIFFIQGKVEDTIPLQIPENISILRLDTDFYESTRHELDHLFPRLSEGGVLIVDDYGFWQGQKKAVDEYFRKNEVRMLLNRIDYLGRVGIKMP
jgi:hypothetical protein